MMAPMRRERSLLALLTSGFMAATLVASVSLAASAVPPPSPGERPLSRALPALRAVAAGEPAQTGSSDVRLRRILAGYSRPVLVTHAPGPGRVIFIVEQTGEIRRATFRDGRWRKLGVFLDLSSRVMDPRKAGNGERGLLGLAFHPDYGQNGLFYVDYTRRGSGGRKGDTVIAEYRRQSAGKAAPSSRRVVMTIDQPYSNHNGGHLAFGPDELLYIGVGDGGGAGDPERSGQDRSTRLGKILRIDPRPGCGRPFVIPSSNPFVGGRGLDEVWSFGLRNPWRFSFDRSTGDLWIGDVGQSRREEVDRSASDGSGRNAGRGRNYGWSRCEGRLGFRPDPDVACSVGTLPVHDYAHGSGRCSVTGGYVHRGPSASGWRGLYVAGDYCGRLFVLGQGGKARLSKVTSRNITSFGEDAAGRIFATDLGGGIHLVRFRGPRP
ncbi:PQQ-dependent sugar dehydrogenase [soil metagenome]